LLRFIKYIATILIVITITGCFGLFDSSADTITGRYNVGWIDVISSRSIDMADKDGDYGGAEIIPAYVYAVGHNKRFIVAKQHPVINKLEEKVDIKKTNYFIIDLTKENYYRQERVLGPLTKVQFDSLCKTLNIGSIEFAMTYPDNP
jgi:hypothetical protein